MPKKVQVYLTRRNLLTLLNKMDRAMAGEQTHCTIVKRDVEHPTHPQNAQEIWVTGVEDHIYYKDRIPGVMHPKDEP